MLEPVNTLSNSDKRWRLIAAMISLVVGIIIMLVKFWAHNLTRSQAVYSDALESIINIFTASFGLLVIYYSAKPADEDHPYGHGKIEYFSAAFEGGLITLAAFFIFFEASKAFFKGHTLANLDLGTWIVAGAGVANLILGWFLLWVGKKFNSHALVGSGHHVISDFWTSAAVIAGLLLVRFTGLVFIDLVVAVLAGAYLLYTGLGLVKKSIDELMDKEDTGLLEHLAEIFERHAHDGIIQLHHTKVIRHGWYHHIDAHMVVPEFWSVHEAHEKLDAFEHKVIKDYKYTGEMNFHLDPCRRNYCRVCNLKECKIRVEAFQERMPVLVEHLRSKVEPKEFRS
jgi:cation diffusion facilitator family transporter